MNTLTKDEFDRLGDIQQLERIEAALKKVFNPVQVFGDAPKKVKTNFRRLSKMVHPDARAGSDDDEIATRAFELLNELHNRAQEQIKNGTYGQDVDLLADNPIFEFAAEGREFKILRELGSGDIADVFLAIDQDGAYYTVKVAREAIINDLMVNEALVVREINSVTDFVKDGSRYLPVCVASLKLNRIRQMNVFAYNPEYMPPPQELYTLEQIAGYYNNEMPIRHVGWLWRRMLAGLQFVHWFGIIHGAVTPDNILVDPVDHGMMLIDWVHASRQQRIITTISNRWKDHYPPEVLKKEIPLPNIDIFMAAKAMLWAAQTIPEPMRRYFNWCTLEYAGRPQKFETLLKEWDHVMYDELGWKREFVVMDFDPNANTNGVDWSWWWA